MPVRLGIRMVLNCPIALILCSTPERPAGDAMVQIEGLETPVSPGSTVGGCILINCLKAEVAQRLTNAGEPPTVLTASCGRGTRTMRRAV